MEKNFSSKVFLKRTLPVAVLIICFSMTLISLFLYLLLINQVKDDLQKTTARIKDDLIIKDERWDLSLYNSDDQISDTYPLYIITSEGYIIERSRPIHGLLDLSRFTLISQYASPTTVETVTGESWRALSKPILSGEHQVGVLLTTFYQPKEPDLPEIDKQLQEVINKVQSQISINGENIDISKLDSRQLSFNISFQVVTRFNKVLYQSNNVNSITRMPTNIDRSYIDNQLKGDPYKEITNEVTGERYLTLTTPLLNDENLTSGIIVLGMPITPVYTVIKNLVGIGLVTGLGVMAFVLLINYRFIKNMRRSIQASINQKPLPKLITFMKKDCKLVIDGETIEIPYSSYQYYFCQALFQKPQKKWEADELLEVLGDKDFGPEKWRKIYDTMVALNKKTSHVTDKLFIVRDKRYFLNTQLVTAAKLVT